MRLIKTKPGGIYVNADHIIDIGTTGDRTISITLSDSTELYAQDYQTKEACEFAFNDLIRRLTEDHKLIELMTEEQAQEEIEKRRKK